MERLRRRLRRIKLDDTRESLDRRINEILFPRISSLRESRDEFVPTISEPKVDLPVSVGIGTSTSPQIVAQTIQQPTLTELARADNIGNRFNLFRRV